MIPSSSYEALYIQKCLSAVLRLSMKQRKEQPQNGVGQSMIRKLTTEKAVKSQKATSADEITEIKLSGRGIKSIESLDLPSLR